MELRGDKISENGRKFGYPECCIKHFVANYKTKFWFESIPWYTSRTLRLNGYIPCKLCANKDNLLP